MHEDENDPEVKANGGNPFHNTAIRTFTENESAVFRITGKHHDSRVSSRAETDRQAGATVMSSGTAETGERALIGESSMEKNTPFLDES
jgi:hypothetical protein